MLWDGFKTYGRSLETEGYKKEEILKAKAKRETFDLSVNRMCSKIQFCCFPRLLGNVVLDEKGREYEDRYARCDAARPVRYITIFRCVCMCTVYVCMYVCMYVYVHVYMSNIVYAPGIFVIHQIALNH